jgi:hypothetical protein
MCGAREAGREGPPYDERGVQQYVGRLDAAPSEP